MRILRIVLTFAASLLIIALLIAWYVGFFNEVKIEEKKEGGYKVVGMEFTGPYSKVGRLMTDVDKKLKDMGIESTRGFGIYYDDPKVIPSEKCRSFAGNILEEKYFDKAQELESSGFRVDSVPIKNAVVAEFPIKNSLSYMIGPMKVYPAFSEYLNKKGYKPDLSMEVYDIPNKKIIYIMQY